MVDPILQVKNLRTHFKTSAGVARAVDDVSFEVRPGETLGIVGESGCGKSVTSLSIMRLVPMPPGFHPSGEIRFGGRDLLQISEREMRKLRGDDVAMIFQEPMTSLNPIFKVGAQIGESLRQHRGLNKRDARLEAIKLLERVGIPDPAKRVDDYPHQMSGGMKQRVMIAMALACEPKLLIADEPTTALDVTIQAQILKLMIELKARTGAAVILITHDLGVVAETCQRVIVMYAGRKIEEAGVMELFDRPAHPYTRGLMTSIPSFGGRGRQRRLTEIPGIVPSLREPIQGCAFAPRCPFAVERCLSEAPDLRRVGEGHIAACHEAERVLATELVA